MRSAGTPISAEAPGPVKDSKLTPRITQTAKALWLVYCGLTGVCFLALMAAGMNGFDALCHAFSTMALGGFSPHDQSVGFYDSALIEAVLVFFMAIAAVNFSTHFLALRRGDGREDGRGDQGAGVRDVALVVFANRFRI